MNLTHFTFLELSMVVDECIELSMPNQGKLFFFFYKKRSQRNLSLLTKKTSNMGLVAFIILNPQCVQFVTARNLS